MILKTGSLFDSYHSCERQWFKNKVKLAWKRVREAGHVLEKLIRQIEDDINPLISIECNGERKDRYIDHKCVHILVNMQIYIVDEFTNTSEWDYCHLGRKQKGGELGVNKTELTDEKIDYFNQSTARKQMDKGWADEIR